LFKIIRLGPKVSEKSSDEHHAFQYMTNLPKEKD